MPTVGRSCGPTEAAESGGGPSRRDILRDDPIVARNVFVNNQAWDAAGGIRFCFFGGGLPEPVVTDNVIADNRAGLWGGGVDLVDAEVTMTHSTIVGNQCDAGPGGGVVVGPDASLNLRDSIVANNTGSGICLEEGYLVTDHCDVFGNSNGEFENCGPSPTDISCDPDFCAPESGDYQLHETSCCQGSGAGGHDIGARGVGCFNVPDVLFFDNFSDQDDAGWYVTSEGNGALAVDAGTYRAALITGAVSGVVESGFVTGDLYYRLRVKPETALPIGTAGLDIYLRRATPERYYRISLSDTEGKLRKRIGAQEETLLTFPCSLVTGTWQSLSFDLVAQQLSGHVDTGDGWQELFVHQDATLPILTGTVGLGLSGAALNERAARFDDVLVAAIDSVLTAAPESGAAGQRPRAADFALRVFPNPANPATTVSFDVPAAGPVRLEIYSVAGRRIATLVDQALAAGRHAIVWHGADHYGRPVPSGIYFTRVEVGNFIVTKRLTLVR